MTEALATWAFPLAMREGAWDDALASATEAIDALLAAGLPFARNSEGAPLLDSADVFNRLTWAGLMGEDNLWRRRRMTALVEDLEAAARAAREPPGSGGGTPFRLALRRSFDLSGLAPGHKVLLRLPMPLPGADHRVTRVQVSASDGASSDLRRADGRLETRFALDGASRVTLAAEVDIVAGDGPAHDIDLDGEQRRLWLRPVEGFIRVTPRVSTLAGHLAGPGGDREAVAAFYAFLMESCCLGTIRYDAFAEDGALDWLLDHHWFDCQLGGCLLVALCRARGIPARVVGGHFLYQTLPNNHFWAEVWLDGEGWRPIDLMSWTLSRGGESADWRDRFFCRLEPRLVTQRLPRQVAGPTSVKFPRSWQMLQTQTDEGISITFRDVNSGALIYEDRLNVMARGDHD
jgi:hypothetical protein